MREKVLTLALALILCLSCALPVSAAGSKFSDVPDGAWYAEAVNAMADGGVLQGKGNGRFDPDAPVTLAELSAIMCRLKGQEVMALGGHWAGSAMEETGLGMQDLFPGSVLFGYADTPAYRADALALMTGYVLKYNDWIRERGAPPLFLWMNVPDRNEYYEACKQENGSQVTYGYYKEGHSFDPATIDTAYDLGLTSGVDANHTCDAFGILTRAQLAQMCYNRGWTYVGSAIAEEHDRGY